MNLDEYVHNEKEKEILSEGMVYRGVTTMSTNNARGIIPHQHSYVIDCNGYGITTQDCDSRGHWHQINNYKIVCADHEHELEQPTSSSNEIGVVDALPQSVNVNVVNQPVQAVEVSK
ncbi:MAG: hypothetical protein MJZ34_08105 [Paludibacteraceae bacterium]|nr:hypothetical protein [Paludibacteraceae bacterium]